MRQWLSLLGIDIALVDGSFWDSDELPGRDMSQIPHPTVTETIARLGERVGEDPEIHFIHLNHSNPLLESGSSQGEEVSDLGWNVGRQGQHFAL